MFYGGFGGLGCSFIKLLRPLLTFITVRYNCNAKQKNKSINACKVMINCPTHAKGPGKTVSFRNSCTRKCPVISTEVPPPENSFS